MEMPFARTRAARIVLLVTQDSLATGKLAKVIENGSFFFSVSRPTSAKSCFKIGILFIDE